MGSARPSACRNGSQACGWIFDSPDTRRITAARLAWLQENLRAIQEQLPLRTVLDVGCGVGYFSEALHRLGYEVTGVDGRAENVAEACRRHPHISFHTANLEDRRVKEIGTFDAIVCFGLLYHLENPLAAMRNFCAMVRHVMFIESVCLPDARPVLLIRDEGTVVDQGLHLLGVYPSSAAVVKMAYRTGFRAVYKTRKKPPHGDFIGRPWRKPLRSVFVASKRELEANTLVPKPIPEPPTVAVDLDTIWTPLALAAKRNRWVRRAANFALKTPQEKYVSIAYHLRMRLKRAWSTLLPAVPLPCRLPFGGVWLAGNDELGDSVFASGYREELGVQRFLDRVLRPGMIVVDAGAHQGFYTLLASQKVGSSGQVIAFEPSPRERKKLKLHLRLNRCRNVLVVAAATGSKKGTATLYQVLGRQTGLNSLRPPADSVRLRKMQVRVVALDQFLMDRNLPQPGLVKLDVEGAELDTLRGATQLLTRTPRPYLCCEVDEKRTQPWGYSGNDLISHVAQYGYRWFSLSEKGYLRPLSASQNRFGNFVALPQEREKEL